MKIFGCNPVILVCYECKKCIKDCGEHDLDVYFYNNYGMCYECGRFRDVEELKRIESSVLKDFNDHKDLFLKMLSKLTVFHHTMVNNQLIEELYVWIDNYTKSEIEDAQLALRLKEVFFRYLIIKV